MTIELQNREYIEKKVCTFSMYPNNDSKCFYNQTIDYIKSTYLKDKSLDYLKDCVKALMDPQFNLTEAEIVQIVNTCPQSDVEFYLVCKPYFSR